MKHLLLAIVCALPLCGSSCGEQPATPQNTCDHLKQSHDEWRAQGLPEWGLGCRRYAGLPGTDFACKMHVVYLPQTQLQNACGVSTELYGCLLGNDVYALDSVNNTVRADYVIEHEFRHWMGGCTTLGTDGNHIIPSIWYPYRGWDLREDVP